MSSINSLDILEAMKRMEWQKAKGHLMAILETYHSEPSTKAPYEREDGDFKAMEARILAFITEVEDNL